MREQAPNYGHSAPTLNELFQQWDQLNRASLSPTTASIYSREVRRLLWGTGAVYAADLTRVALQSHMVSLAEGGQYAASSLTTIAGVLRTWCSWLIETGALVGANPARGLKLPAILQRAPEYLTKTELDQALGVARMVGSYFEVLTAARTGLRRVELRHLRWEDISLARGLLTVSSPVKRQRSRVIPLAKGFVEELSLVAAGSSGYIWDHNGRAFSNRHWDRVLEPVRQRIPKISGWHIFRHTFASLLAQQGVSIAKISKWLGHSQVTLTMKYYANLAPENYDDDINALET